MPCIVFAHDRPEFDLIDESNPATGGIRLTYSGLTEPTSDTFNKCPPSDVYGGQTPRFLRINLLCNPGQADLSTGASLFREVSSCVYELNATTKYACGIAGDPYAPPVSRAGTQFGYTVLGSVLTVGIYSAFLFVDARGYLDGIKARLPSWAGGRSYAAPPSGGFASSGGAYGSA